MIEAGIKNIDGSKGDKYNNRIENDIKYLS